MAARVELQTEMRSSQASVLKVPSVLRCGLMIFGVKLMLKICGFGRTIRWIRGRVAGIRTVGATDAAAVTAAERSVAMAGALYPGRALCLEQSLVLYYMLRRQGVDVKYRQGIQPHPFSAHAWVEYRGVPINDLPEHVGWFTLLPDQLP